MYTHLDWCEAGYHFGRLRENWTSTPFRLFLSQADKITIDNSFKLLQLKLKNKLFDVEELQDFYCQLANLSSEIDKVVKNIQC